MQLRKNNKMNKFFKSIILMFAAGLNFGVHAQDFQICTATHNDLKLYQRAQLLSYVCEGKKLLTAAETKLLKMQIDLIQPNKIMNSVDPNGFALLKALADEKELCAISVSRAFVELKKYGITNGSVGDDEDYCKK